MPTQGWRKASAFPARRRWLPGGVVHCFQGGWETARQYLDLGLCLGIGGALLRREGASAQVAVPWPQDAPFPLTELFCFASVGQREGKRYVFYAFSGNWTPLMPGKTRKS